MTKKLALAGKVVVVIGGASGIGAALCRLLAAQHAKVIIADVALPAALQLAQQLGAAAHSVDVRSPDSVETLIEDVVAKHGVIHFLINSAGVLVQGNAEDFNQEEWTRVLNINAQGAVVAAMSAYRRMVRQGFGHIINISSVSGLNATPLCLPYVTSKYAVVGLSLGLRAEAKAHGIHVSVVCPGNVATPMVSAMARKPFFLTPIISPEYAAQQVLHGILRNRPIIVFPTYALVFWWLERIMPWLSSILRDIIVKKAIRRSATI